MTKGAFIFSILFIFSDPRFYLQKVVEGIEHDSIYIESINC